MVATQVLATGQLGDMRVAGVVEQFDVHWIDGPVAANLNSLWGANAAWRLESSGKHLKVGLATSRSKIPKMRNPC